MITIGVVDDDSRYVKYLSDKIEKYLNSKEITIQGFTNPELFIESFFSCKFDLLFIDYDMQVNGYEIIDMMSMYEQLKGTILIMVTGYNHLGLVEKGYHRNIYRFVHKSEDDAVFKEAIVSGWTEAINSKDTFSFEYNHCFYQFEYKNVYCVYSSGNDLNIQQKDELTCVRMPIKKIVNDLLVRGFLHANSNTLINSKHIFSVSKKMVVMDDNSHYSLSRSGYTELKNWYKHNE